MKDLGVVIQNNLSPERHIEKILGDILMMLRIKWMTFHFLDNGMIRKHYNYYD